MCSRGRPAGRPARQTSAEVNADAAAVLAPFGKTAAVEARCPSHPSRAPSARAFACGPRSAGHRNQFRSRLAHCEGYRVDAEDGRLGFVEAVRADGSPDGHLLCVRAGRLGLRLLFIPVAGRFDRPATEAHLVVRSGSSRRKRGLRAWLRQVTFGTTRYDVAIAAPRRTPRRGWRCWLSSSGACQRSFRQLRAAWAPTDPSRLRASRHGCGGDSSSFSVGMQVTVTATNTLVGLVAVMVVFGTFRPLAAIGAASSGMRR